MSPVRQLFLRPELQLLLLLLGRPVLWRLRHHEYEMNSCWPAGRLAQEATLKSARAAALQPALAGLGLAYKRSLCVGQKSIGARARPSGVRASAAKVPI